MLQRIILTILLSYYRVLIMIDPNTGNEIGKHKDDKKNEAGNTIGNRWVRIINSSALFFLEILSVIFRLNEPVNLFDWFLFISATIGLFISYWAYESLGNYYTFTLGIRKDHNIITKGPYNYFVHPGYLGQYLIIIGSIMFYRISIFITIATTIYVTYMFNKRMKAEEDMLINQFGNEFTEFSSKRWRMFPYLFELLN